MENIILDIKCAAWPAICEQAKISPELLNNFTIKEPIFTWFTNCEQKSQDLYKK